MNSDVKDSFLVSLVSVLTPMGTWQDTILNFYVTIILKNCIGVQVLCNVVLVSIAQQSEPSGGIHIPPLS